jgi:hypothetical protein
MNSPPASRCVVSAHGGKPTNNPSLLSVPGGVKARFFLWLLPLLINPASKLVWCLESRRARLQTKLANSDHL